MVDGRFFVELFVRLVDGRFFVELFVRLVDIRFFVELFVIQYWMMEDSLLNNLFDLFLKDTLLNYL